MAIAPITQLRYPQTPSGTSQFLSGLLEPLNDLATYKTNQLLQQQERNRLSPALKALGFPDEYKELPTELLKPLITGNKNLATSGDIGVAIEGLSQNARNQLNKMEPGFKLQAYRSYLENPSQFVQIANSSYPDQIQPQIAQAIQKPAPLSKPVEKALKSTSEAADQARLMELAEPKAKLSKEERIKQHYEKKAAEQLAKPAAQIKTTPELQKPLQGTSTIEKPTKEQRIAEHKTQKELEREKKLSPEEKELSDIKKVIEEENPKRRTVTELIKEGRQKKEAEDEVRDERKQRHSAEQESRKRLTEFEKAKSAANNNNKRLGRMTNLIDNGSLPFAVSYKLLEKMKESNVHTNIPLVGPLVDLIFNGVIQNAGTLGEYAQKSITSRDVEEFEKLTQDFTRDAKDVYGARVTNMELEQFLKMIPNLLQTDYGKRAVIRNMKNFNDAAILKANTAEKIVKANGGKAPENLDLLVNKIAGPELDRLANEYVNGINDMMKNIQSVELPYQQVLNPKLES